MARTHEIDMTTGSIFKKVLLFSLPLMLSGILQLLFNAADVIVVGKFAGSLSLAAVGSTSSLINLLVNVAIGISVGVNVLAARYFGSGNEQGVCRCVHSAMALSIVLGLLTGIAGFVFSTPLLEMMDTDPEVLPKATLYLKIYFLGVPASIVYNFGAAILRAVGDTDRPLRYLTISGIVNVVLNLIFVILFHMDVAGVGLATVVSQYISAVLVVRCLMRTESSYQLQLRKLRFHWDMIGQIAAVGLPAGLQSTLFSLSNVIIQSGINSFGSVTMAGNSAASNLEGFIYIAMNSFYHAAMSFTSQNYGARKPERIRRVLFTCTLMAVGSGILLAALVYFFREPLLSLYISKKEPNRDAVLAIGTIRFQKVLLLYYLCGIMEVLVGVQRGLGSSWTPMIISTVGSCVLRIIWVDTIFAAHHTLEALLLIYPVSWILTNAAHSIALFFTYRRRCKKQLAV